MSDETKKRQDAMGFFVVGFLATGFIFGAMVSHIWTTAAWNGAAKEEASHLKNVLAEVAPSLKAVITHRLRGTQKWVTVEGAIEGKPFRVQCVCRDVIAAPLKWEASPPSGDWHADRLAEEYMATEPLVVEGKQGMVWMSKEKFDERWAHTWREVK